MKGMVFNIQRFCVHDGPGIRTTVFMKGCPLSCVWCHNPESHYRRAEILYTQESCILCGACMRACPQKLHTLNGRNHIYERASCDACGLCASACPTGALELSGRLMETEDVLAQVLRDADFYRSDNGGLTLSGGEPMAQPEFALDLARKAREAGLHVCMETCGYCLTEDLKRMLPHIHIFLYDFKIADGRTHQRYTGADNALILENLAFLSKAGAEIILRCPIVPGINFEQEHFEAIRRTVQSHPGIRQIDLEPYHPLGIQKNRRLGRITEYKESDFLDRGLLETYAGRLQDQVTVPVHII